MRWGSVLTRDGALAVLLLACAPPAFFDALEHAFADAVPAALPLFLDPLALFVVRGVDDLQGVSFLELD